MNSHCSFPRERSGTTSRSSIGSARRAGAASLQQRRRDRSWGDKAATDLPSPLARLSTYSSAAGGTSPKPHLRLAELGSSSAQLTSPAVASAAGAAATAEASAAKLACAVVKRGGGGTKAGFQSRGGGAQGGIAHAQNPVKVGAKPEGSRTVPRGRVSACGTGPSYSMNPHICTLHCTHFIYLHKDAHTTQHTNVT